MKQYLPAWLKKGSGAVAGTACGVLRKTVPAPFLTYADRSVFVGRHCGGNVVVWCADLPAGLRLAGGVNVRLQRGEATAFGKRALDVRE